MPDAQPALPKLDPSSLPGPETIQRTVLPNGMILLARPNFASPSVVISGYLNVGSLDETPEQAGLADLTVSSLMRGSSRRSFRDIYESIESIGASLNFGISKHTMTFQGKSLAEDLGTLIELLGEVLREPTFPTKEVEQVRAESLTALAIRDQDTNSRAQLAFSELAYPDHPYRVPGDGYRETVAGLKVADLRRFHSRHFRPHGMVIAIVGAVEPRNAFDTVVRSLGDWSPGERPERPPLPAVGLPGRMQRATVPLDGKSQSDIVLGAPGPSRFDSDYLAAVLGNNILGRFGMMGRIGDAVRERAGLAYYAYSSISGGPGPGPWRVIAGVNPANVERAIELIRSELRRFSSRRVSQDELRDNQANFIGRLPLQLESNEGVAGALVHIERYQLGLEYYQTYAERIASITRAQVLEQAQRFLHPDHVAIGVAGPSLGG